MKLFFGSILFFTVASFSPLAYGQAISWTNRGTDSNFNNGANWTTAAGTGSVPGFGNTVGIFAGFQTTAATSFIQVSQGGPALITINTSVDEGVDDIFFTASFNSQSVLGGTVDLNFNAGSTFFISPPANIAAMEVLGGATLNFTGNLQTTGNVTVGTDSSTIDPVPGEIPGAGTLVLGAGNVNLDGAGSFTIGQGAVGSVTQLTGSTVTAGQNFEIGDGANGSYTVNSGAVLNLGDQVTPAATGYTLDVGTGSASTTGTLTINGTLNAQNDNSFLFIGAGGTGSVIQTGNVTVGGMNSIIFVSTNGSYQLQGGALQIGNNATDTSDLEVDGGTFTQTGGTLTADAATHATIGAVETASYTLSGASTVTADFQGGLTIGLQSGANGTVTQNGGILSAEGLIVVGDGGTGTYTLNSGTLNANDGLGIGTGGGTGTFNYNGGTINVTNGIEVGSGGTFNQRGDLTLSGVSAFTLDSGGNYNLASGTLSVGGSTAFTNNGGNFNFAGGNVDVTGTAWTDPFNGSVTGTSTIDTTVAGALLSGNLTGTGTLNIIGGNQVELSGTSTGSWGAKISGDSTLLADSAESLSSTGTYLIGSGSTLTVNASLNPTDTFSGSVGNFTDATDPGGTATFNTGTNKLVLSGTVNLTATSQTIIGAGGSLEVDRGTISNIDGSAGNAGDTFDVGNGTSTGTVKLLGSNILPNVTVNTKATLLASNITGSVTNFGTLSSFGTNSAPATLFISGSLTSTGTILIHADGNSIDTIGTAGSPLTTATLSGLVKVSGVGTLTNVPIVFTSGGLTATIGTAPGDLMSTSTALFSTTLTNNGTDLLLSTVQNTLTSFAQTANERAVAGVIDPIINAGGPFPSGFNTVLGGLNNLPASAIPGALESLTPESLQYSRRIAFENSTFLVERMNGIDNDIRGGYGGLDTNAISVVAPGFNTGLGRSMGSFLAYDSPAFHNSAPNGVNYYPNSGSSPSGASMNSSSESSSSSNTSSPVFDSSTQVISDSPNPYMANQTPSGPQTPGFSEFISGDAILADIDNHGTNAPSSDASYTAADATAGVSYRMSSNLAAGVLFDYNHTDAKTDGAGSRTHVDSYSPGLFATYFDKGFYVNGLFSFGYNNYDNDRKIDFLNRTATSHPDGQQYVGDVDFGYDFHPDKNWVVGPTLGVTYTHLDVDSFTEEGAPGANLHVHDQSADSVRTRLGGHVIFQTNTGDVLLQPNLTLMWQHEYLDNSDAITSSFSDFGTSFSTYTAAPGRDSALIGTGLTATLNTSLTLYFNYLADVGADDFFAQTVVVGLKTRF